MLFENCPATTYLINGKDKLGPILETYICINYKAIISTQMSWLLIPKNISISGLCVLKCML